MEKVELNNFSNFYKGKRVFLTGHTGFKGAWMLTWLQSLGAIVKGYALAPEDDKSLFNQIVSYINFENVFADVRDSKIVEDEIVNFKPDIIFHLAAQALVRKSYQMPSETFEINTIGTTHVLDAVNKLTNKCTVIIITTDKVYENKEINYHYKEEDRLGGYDPYSASKAACEIAVSSFRNSFFNRAKYSEHQKAIITARAGNVIGGGDWSEDRIIPDIIRALQNNTTINIRNPNAVRPWQHVLEPLSGYLLLAKLAYSNYENLSTAYNFGPLGIDNLTVKKIVEIALENWGSGVWKDISNSNDVHEAKLLMLDITKAQTELIWQPKLTSEQAIEWTVEWYKKGIENHFDFTMQQIKQYEQYDFYRNKIKR
jgi:CDP-glucose 4,6-dehydratase